jgi:AcrR family transcriptional regulator
MRVMVRKVKASSHTRLYDATRRREAAAETRNSVVAAAARLFADRGYTATTMAEIASAAGVALDTVYASVGPKPVLFRHLIETAISGGDHPVPAEARGYVQQIRAEPDAGRKLDLYAQAIREIQERLAPLFRVLRDAAPTDPQLDALWREIGNRRAVNMRLLAAELEATGGLRGDLSVDDAADIIWATNSSEFFLLLVHDRGWDVDRFEQWLARTWKDLLLRAERP